jgi:hypothetical protein
MPLARNINVGGDVIACLAIGIEACDDGVGAICVRDRGDGFEVFINGGLLPDGREHRDFGSGADCLTNAFAYAMRIAKEVMC